MWRTLRLPISKSKISPPHSIKKQCLLQRPYSSSSSGSGGGTKFVVGLLAATGAGFAGAIAYGKYDSKFRKVLKENVPYVDLVYKWLDGDQQKSSIPVKTVLDEKSLLKKKLDREKAASIEVKKPADPLSPKVSGTASSQDPKIFDSNDLKKSEIKPSEAKVESLEIPETQHASNENILSEMINKLQTTSEGAKLAHEEAVKAIKKHTNTLYEALDLAEGKDGDIVWKDVNKTATDKNIALQIAEEKASHTRDILEKLKLNVKKIGRDEKNNPFVKKAEESVEKVAKELEKYEDKIKIVETEAKTATEYQKLVNSSKEQFRKELEIVLPNYIYGDKAMTENDLNMLIAHAHRRIEQLQKQLAKQQVTEQIRVDEAVRLQKIKNVKNTASQIEAELEKRNIDLENAIEDRVAFLKENFEIELRKQLRRQAAAHADHIQEVLKVQEQELERKFSLDVEEKLLHQKGVFISEVSGNMARLKGILAFLKAKSEFDVASKKSQALWLACQAMSYKITAENAGCPCPLGKDIAAVKIAADEESESEFINSVLAGIPIEAVERGVYNTDVLKERFQDVKKVCRKVAIIDENNDSLYRYFLSYLQSFLIIDKVSIPKAEIEGKVAVDVSTWDTFDVLARISYSLKINDLELALRYANQLKGAPREVSKDWMNEVRLLLETQLAVKALIAHAAAVGVQAYH